MPWQEVVALASSQHRCQTILVRVENRERLGLAPIRQAYDPQTHQAKCLACPTFYACAPRRRSLFAGSLQELFCGRACREAYACQTSAQGLRRVVFARDGGVCALCGADGHALVERLRALAAAPHGRRVAAALRANAAWADFPRCLDRLLEKPSDGRAWEADHAVRVADGGGEALADRVQTLCVPCHKVKTKQEAKRAAAERRAAAHSMQRCATPAHALRCAIRNARARGDERCAFCAGCRSSRASERSVLAARIAKCSAALHE